MGKPILNEESGARTVAKKIAASAIREQKTFEVIDYDSLGDNYILLYKSIAIKHSQTFDQNSSGAGAGGYVQNGWGILDMVCPVVTSGGTVEKSIASRVVTYKLYCKILKDGKVTIVKKDLAICAISAEDSVQQVSGSRIYAPSLQVLDKYITYSYEYGIVALNNPNVNAIERYDGAMNLEDWNLDNDKKPIWTRTKHVVGIINIDGDEGSAVGYDCSRDYEVTGEVYGKDIPFPCQQYSAGEADI